MRESARALLLIILANSAPWAVARILGRRWAASLDFGYTLRDGRRLFGGHKTWRGLISGVAVCAAAAPILGLTWAVGAGFGAASLVGDALSSGVKRRLAQAPGTEVPGLDQLPEALLPLLIFATALELTPTDILATAVCFMILDVLMTRLRHAGAPP